MKLSKKVVLITGASSGIGKESAILFAKKSCNVVITYNQTKASGEEALKECKKYSDAILLKLDVTNNESIKKAIFDVVKKFGRIDVLINNAGVLSVKPFAKQTFEELQWLTDVNLAGLMKVTRETLPQLEKQKEAVIINIASIAGKYVFEDYVAYCATKFGVHGFTQGLALELPKNIRVYSLNPSMTSTRMTNHEGVPVAKVADLIVKTAEETLNKRSGDDIDVPEYVKDK